MANLNNGVNQDTIQELNRSLLLHNLRKAGLCSRVQLANETKLKQATVTNIMKDFISWGLVKETGFLNGNKGRRSIGIEINTDKYRVIGIRLTRKYYSVGLFDLAGNLLKNSRVDLMEDSKYIDVADKIIKTQNELTADLEDSDILAIGMALPGPYISKTKRMALITGAEALQGVDIIRQMEKLSSYPIFLEHDANAGALAHMWDMKEAYFGQTLVYIAVGQGIGAGIIINGSIFGGAVGTAGEIGHMSIEANGVPCVCGNKGCLERYTSSLELIEKLSKLKAPAKKYSFEEVTDLIKHKDKTALSCYTEALQYLGVGVANVVNIINPNIIIIGDEMTKPDCGMVEEIVEDVVKERVISQISSELKIETSNYEGDPVLNGAAIVAINQIFKSPTQYIK